MTSGPGGPAWCSVVANRDGSLAFALQRANFLRNAVESIVVLAFGVFDRSEARWCEIDRNLACSFLFRLPGASSQSSLTVPLSFVLPL